ncbi:MAG: hypothetical protein H7A05_00090 [Pseudomonadales bacterium]|nr:hypothetical protein [Pseudomonadales bacterium]MCP5330097.1 hypothetical protein [Pseudomonadales bacterium]MCP5342993.1 hypothetical protein [Pseudomonadales bacterium]
MDAVAALLDQNRSNELRVFSPLAARQLAQAGYTRFEHLWSLPQEFVEPANLRRNGWSGVSILTLPNEQGEQEVYYLKRQENQTRYSLRYPTGTLTFRYEADALHRALVEGWPAVELVACGFRTSPGNGAPQGLILTRGLPYPNLSSYREQVSDWTPYLPVLRRIGEQLLQMHQSRWQHGALFPVHLFLELATGEGCLIDFERARRRLFPQWAAYADLTQFIRRADWLPDEALAALLESHLTAMPQLRKRLRKRFPNRFQ